MAYDSEKHDRQSLRLPDYDYSSPGAYFVTLCVQGRACLFGSVVEGRMELNAAGEIVQAWWERLPARYPCAALDAYVIMPNHVHGVLRITETRENTEAGAIHESHLLQPQTVDPPHPERDIKKRRRMLLPKMIGYFKMNTAKRVNRRRGTPGVSVWQRNYHDHIVRGRPDLERIRRYIAQNPAAWHRDRNHPNRS